MESASSDGLFTSYKTLKEGEIRLLHLQPRRNRLAPTALESSQLGTPGLVEIECSFSLTNLDDPFPFEALSYTWGDPDAHIPVKIDGELVNALHTSVLTTHLLPSGSTHYALINWTLTSQIVKLSQCATSMSEQRVWSFF